MYAYAEGLVSTLDATSSCGSSVIFHLMLLMIWSTMFLFLLMTIMLSWVSLFPIYTALHSPFKLQPAVVGSFKVTFPEYSFPKIGIFMSANAIISGMPLLMLLNVMTIVFSFSRTTIPLLLDLSVMSFGISIVVPFSMMLTVTYSVCCPNRLYAIPPHNKRIIMLNIAIIRCLLFI